MRKLGQTSLLIRGPFPGNIKFSSRDFSAKRTPPRGRGRKEQVISARSLPCFWTAHAPFKREEMVLLAKSFAYGIRELCLRVREFVASNKEISRVCFRVKH
jgi:hypothetical protein